MRWSISVGRRASFGETEVSGLPTPTAAQNATPWGTLSQEGAFCAAAREGRLTTCALQVEMLTPEDTFW